MTGYLLAISLLLSAARAAQPAMPDVDSQIPQQVSYAEMQSLIQRFADEQYGTAFRVLGFDCDFDHGHFLYSERLPTTKKPIAVLWHTQERDNCGRKPARFNVSARNWVQWLGSGRLENASRFERKSYPDDPAWNVFVKNSLSAARERHTVHANMLDPELLGFPLEAESQWTFSRRDCDDQTPGQLEVTLAGESDKVCLEISQYGDW